MGKYNGLYIGVVQYNMFVLSYSRTVDMSNGFSVFPASYSGLLS